MGCCCSKLGDEPVAETPSKGEAQQETQPKGEIQGETPSKPLDEPLAETPPKGETQQETQQETQLKGETQGGTPSKGQRARERTILLLTFTSIISEASELLKPMKAVSEFIKKILEVTKVSFNLPDETSLFKKSQSACRR